MEVKISNRIYDTASISSTGAPQLAQFGPIDNGEEQLMQMQMMLAQQAQQNEPQLQQPNQISPAENIIGVLLLQRQQLERYIEQLQLEIRQQQMQMQQLAAMREQGLGPWQSGRQQFFEQNIPSFLGGPIEVLQAKHNRFRQRWGGPGPEGQQDGEPEGTGGRGPFRPHEHNRPRPGHEHRRRPRPQQQPQHQAQQQPKPEEIVKPEQPQAVGKVEETQIVSETTQEAGKQAAAATAVAAAVTPAESTDAVSETAPEESSDGEESQAAEEDPEE